MVKTVVESKTKTAVLGFDQPFCVIGERINPTGRKKLAAELEAGDYSTVEKDALAQVMAGANILDINAGVVYNSNPNPNETEPPLMTALINLVQGLTDVPLCIDSSVPEALEAGLQAAEGRPLLNSVTGEEERLEFVLPLVKKIQCACCCDLKRRHRHFRRPRGAFRSCQENRRTRGRFRHSRP